MRIRAVRLWHIFCLMASMVCQSENTGTSTVSSSILLPPKVCGMKLLRGGGEEIWLTSSEGEGEQSGSEMMSQASEASGEDTDIALPIESAGMLSEELVEPDGSISDLEPLQGANHSLLAGRNPLLLQDELDRELEEDAMKGKQYVTMVGLTVDLGYLKEGALEKGVYIPPEVWRDHLWSHRKRAYAERMRQENEGGRSLALLQEAGESDRLWREKRAGASKTRSQHSKKPSADRDGTKAMRDDEDHHLHDSDSFIASESGCDEMSDGHGRHQQASATGGIDKKGDGAAQHALEDERQLSSKQASSAAKLKGSHEEQALDEGGQDGNYARLPFNLVNGRAFSGLEDNVNILLRLDLRDSLQGGAGQRIRLVAPLQERDYDRLVTSNNASSYRIIDPVTLKHLPVNVNEGGISSSSEGHVLLRGKAVAMCLAAEMGIRLSGRRGCLLWKLVRCKAGPVDQLVAEDGEARKIPQPARALCTNRPDVDFI